MEGIIDYNISTKSLSRFYNFGYIACRSDCGWRHSRDNVRSF